MLDSPLGAYRSFFCPACSVLTSSFHLSFCVWYVCACFFFSIWNVPFFYVLFFVFFVRFFSLPPCKFYSNLHKYIYAFHLCIPKNLYTHRHWLHQKILCGWRERITVDLLYTHRGPCVSQANFPVNLFEFIYILAAISLHKLLLNIPKLRNLFAFE